MPNQISNDDYLTFSNVQGLYGSITLSSGIMNSIPFSSGVCPPILENNISISLPYSDSDLPKLYSICKKFDLKLKSNSNNVEYMIKNIQYSDFNYMMSNKKRFSLDGKTLHISIYDCDRGNKELDFVLFKKFINYNNKYN